MRLGKEGIPQRELASFRPSPAMAPRHHPNQSSQPDQLALTSDKITRRCRARVMSCWTIFRFPLRPAQRTNDSRQRGVVDWFKTASDAFSDRVKGRNVTVMIWEGRYTSRREDRRCGHGTARSGSGLVLLTSVRWRPVRRERPAHQRDTGTVSQSVSSVSYTHLTLPTTILV